MTTLKTQDRKILQLRFSRYRSCWPLRFRELPIGIRCSGSKARAALCMKNKCKWNVEKMMWLLNSVCDPIFSCHVMSLKFALCHHVRFQARATDGFALRRWSQHSQHNCHDNTLSLESWITCYLNHLNLNLKLIAIWLWIDFNLNRNLNLKNYLEPSSCWGTRYVGCRKYIVNRPQRDAMNIQDQIQKQFTA